MAKSNNKTHKKRMDMNRHIPDLVMVYFKTKMLLGLRVVSLALIPHLPINN